MACTICGISPAVAVCMIATLSCRADARANNVIFDISIFPPTLMAVPDSASVATSEQTALNTSVDATNVTTLIGMPAVDGTHDAEGGTMAVAIRDNDIWALAGTNDATVGVDLYTATGGGTTSAATAASLQFAYDPMLDVYDPILGIFHSAETAARFQVDVEDLGDGSSIDISDNAMRAELTVNRADVGVTGNINPSLTSAERGQSEAGLGGMASGATVLATNTQANYWITTVVGLSGEISAAATVDGTPTNLSAGTISVSSNEAYARYSGNASIVTIDIDNDRDLNFVGSAGASNLQVSAINFGNFTFLGSNPFSASNERLLFELGDRFNSTGLASLNESSAILNSSNIIGKSRLNDTNISIVIAGGMDFIGVFLPGDPVNIINSGTMTSTTGEISADVFVHNMQLYGASDSVVDLYSGDTSPNSAILSGLIDDINASQVRVDMNTIAAEAAGNVASNEIIIDYPANFNGSMAIQSAQNASSIGVVLSDVAAGIDVDVASSGGVGLVTESTITTKGNTISASGIQNAQTSIMDIRGHDVVGTGAVADAGIQANAATFAKSVAADFGVLSDQVAYGENNGGSLYAASLLYTTIDVDVANVGGLPGTELGASSLDVSDNTASARAYGNLSGGSAISIAATTLKGTVGIANVQIAWDQPAVASTIREGYYGLGIIDIDVTPQILRMAAISANRNDLLSAAWVNLAGFTGNSLDIGGVSVSDGDAAHVISPIAAVVRSGSWLSSTEVAGSFMVLNDQTIEDMDFITLNASIGGADFVQLDVGGGMIDSVIADASLMANGNDSLASAIGNQATSRAVITATSLDASISLANVQTSADEDEDGLSLRLMARIVGADIGIRPGSGADGIARTSMQVNDNTATASARVNLAQNSVALTAHTLEVTGVTDGNADQISVALGDGSYASGAALLLNDQFVDSLFSLEASMESTDLYIQASVENGSLVDSNWQIESNIRLALAAGNDATNGMRISVDRFGLEAADAAGGALNGPAATMASNQSGASDESRELVAEITASRTVIDISDVDMDILGSSLTADNNQVTAFSRSNNVVNTLSVTGTSFSPLADATPTASVIGNPSGDILLEETGFVIGSRQVNDLDVLATLNGTDFLVFGMRGGEHGSVRNSTMSVSGNRLIAEGRGSDSANELAMEFGANAAQAFIASRQFSTTNTPAVLASALDSNVGVDIADQDVGFVNSSARIGGNAIEALASASRVSNTLTLDGTNLAGGSGAPLSVHVLQGAAPSIEVTADVGIVNVQGASELQDDNDETVTVLLEGNSISGAMRDFVSGALRVSYNRIAGLAVDQSSVNLLLMHAEGSVGGEGRPTGGTIVSQQMISDGNFVEVDLRDSVVEEDIADMSFEESGTASIVGNQLAGRATGGSAINRIDVVAGASISGRSASAATIGDTFVGPAALNADFSLLNIQLGDPWGGDGGTDSDIDTEIVDASILISVHSGVWSDVLTVNNNIVSSQALGFISNNDISLGAASSADSSVHLANLQGLYPVDFGQTGAGTSINAHSSSVLAAIRVDGDMEGSSLSTSGNHVGSLAGGNRAVNSLRASAGASFEGSSGTGVVINPGGIAPIAVAGAGYAVLNLQSVAGYDDARLAVIGAEIDLVSIGVDGIGAISGVSNSAVHVDGNSVEAFATGNDAVNSLELNTDGFAYPTAAISSVQTASNAAIHATGSNITVGIGLSANIGSVSGASNHSTLSVRNNSIGATAIGNSAISSVGGVN